MNIRKRLNWFACLCFIVCLSSCYQSSEPLSNPGAVLDHALLGKWQCLPEPKNNDSDDKAVLKIFQFDDSQYYVEWIEGDKITRYRSYPTVANNTVLLNVQEISETGGDGKWVFLRYHVTQTNELKFSIVSDTAVTSKIEKEALDEIRKRAGQDNLYSGVASCSLQK